MIHILTFDVQAYNVGSNDRREQCLVTLSSKATRGIHRSHFLYFKVTIKQQGEDIVLIFSILKSQSSNKGKTSFSYSLF